MSLFQCEECGCRDNTATSGYWFRNDKGNPCQGRKLCAACDPSIDKWHDVFKREYLPKGEFFTNREGNLEHKTSGKLCHEWLANQQAPAPEAEFIREDGK